MHTSSATTHKKSDVKKWILLSILVFVFYNYVMISNDGNSVNNNSNKEVALKHVQDYVIQLEQDVSKFQHIIENNIKPRNDIYRSEDKVSGSDIGTNLRGIMKNIGLNKAMKDLLTVPKDIIKQGMNWRDSISNLLGLSFISTNSDTTTNSDVVNDSWASSLKRKLNCLYGGKGAIYLYHARKAAGSSIKEILDFATKRWRVRYMFTEGKTLDAGLLAPPGIFRVISLRDPIKRIESLYWYEHVSWYAENKKQTKKIFQFSEWFDAWCDGSEWKTTFITKNPGNVYVEVENYYTKVLSGWQGPEPVSREHYNIAKANLEKFDFIMIQEWMADISQVDAMTALFPGRLNIAAGSKVKGNKDLKQRYESIYAPDIKALKEKMKVLNKYDLELFEYARLLTAQRVKLVPDIVDDVLNHLHKPSVKECSTTMDRSLNYKLGLSQPFGHKGPFKGAVDD